MIVGFLFNNYTEKMSWYTDTSSMKLHESQATDFTQSALQELEKAMRDNPEIRESLKVKKAKGNRRKLRPTKG